MKVEIYQAILTIEDRSVRLTKAVAKQFPILPATERWQAGEKGLDQPAPVCKVAGKVLGQPHDWLYLVEDPTAGLAWVAAMQPAPEFVQPIIAKGGWVDDPASVPTVIL